MIASCKIDYLHPLRITLERKIPISQLLLSQDVSASKYFLLITLQVFHCCTIMANYFYRDAQCQTEE